MSAPARRPDAVQNRTRIVEAARAALAESDHVHLNEIAKRAGVGQGTLYRNFPNREALLAEVYRRDVEELVTAASALLAEHEPVEALRHWLDRVIDYAEIKYGVLAALEPAAWQDLVAHSQNPIEGALDHLLNAGPSADCPASSMSAATTASSTPLRRGCPHRPSANDHLTFLRIEVRIDQLGLAPPHLTSPHLQHLLAAHAGEYGPGRPPLRTLRRPCRPGRPPCGPRDDRRARG